MNPTLRIALLHQSSGGGGPPVSSSTPTLSSRVATISAGSRTASATK